ncbi:hypothetical protein DLAC_10336 [Tieghemostelium lacteum]|uniref:MD-2-related lipid-recognition domain-containing protein n=1 Tax=Tieghemostelium lacteum TaxID=361077 RepID=A0A151Z5M7_TIELA|nr:hypothetical protein DLAC_10336 [Tieghemostelium lacteum]|eukprot:KYQ89104.1 hypothetical protein DLAC_10336 [Tieghemostelium lacteum]
MNKSIIFVFVLLALATPALCDIWTWCGTSADHLTINSVTITPDPPVKGQLLTVTASGTLNEQVTAGNAHITVKYGFITLINENQNICSSENPIPCPIAAGQYSHTINVTIPSSAPSGKYTGNVVITDQNSQEITCVNVDLDL